jgi:hypothetical protein
MILNFTLHTIYYNHAQILNLEYNCIQLPKAMQNNTKIRMDYMISEILNTTASLFQS